MNSRPITWEVRATHLYPGAEGTLLDALPATDASPQPCVISFSDGIVVYADTEAGPSDDWIVSVPAYATAKGTAIEAKRWSASLECRGGRMMFRIGKKLPFP